MKKGHVNIVEIDGGYRVTVQNFVGVSFWISEQDLKDLHSLISELLETETCKHNFIGTLPSKNSECTLCGVKFSETETVKEPIPGCSWCGPRLGLTPEVPIVLHLYGCPNKVTPPSNSEKEEVKEDYPYPDCIRFCATTKCWEIFKDCPCHKTKEENMCVHCEKKEAIVGLLCDDCRYGVGEPPKEKPTTPEKKGNCPGTSYLIDHSFQSDNGAPEFCSACGTLKVATPEKKPRLHCFDCNTVHELRDCTKDRLPSERITEIEKELMAKQPNPMEEVENYAIYCANMKARATVQYLDEQYKKK